MFTPRHDMLSYPHLCLGVVEPSKLLVATVRLEMHSFSVLSALPRNPFLLDHWRRISMRCAAQILSISVK